MWLERDFYLLMVKLFSHRYKFYDLCICVKLTTSLFFSLLFSHSICAETEETARVLPSVTVFATKGPDNKVAYRSEVEWHLSNDPTITRAQDGTYTAGDTTQPYSLKSLIVSLGSPAVNFNISYAKNSTSMTADGRSVFSTLIEALVLLDEGTTVLLTPNTSSQSNKSITQRRVDFIRETLVNSNGINLKVTPSKTLKSTGSKSKQNNQLQILIQRKI